MLQPFNIFFQSCKGFKFLNSSRHVACSTKLTSHLLIINTI